MQLGLRTLHGLDDEFLQFARQLDVPNLFVDDPPIPGGGLWRYADLLALRRRIESAGLTLAGLQGLPEHVYHLCKLGRPGRDAQIEEVQRLIRAVGQAGIPILGYNWNLTGAAWRTEYTPTGRGGAWVTKYDHALLANAPLSEDGPVDDETVWANLAYFLRAVIPVAEEAGVTLALHPDDPPVPQIQGLALVLRSVAAYRRAVELVPSPSNKVKFCQGTIAEMCATPEEVYDAIRGFASRGQIAFVHFRNVRGAVPRFEETFIDEGKIDMLKAMRAYHEAGFKGVLIPDHAPAVVGDSDFGHRARAYTIGYMKGLLHQVVAGG